MFSEGLSFRTENPLRRKFRTVAVIAALPLAIATGAAASTFACGYIEASPWVVNPIGVAARMTHRAVPQIARSIEQAGRDFKASGYNPLAQP